MMCERLCEQRRWTEDRLRAAPGRVHLVGIGGIGMAGVAFLLQQRGFHVAGCDQSPGRMGDWLRAAGIGVHCGHAPAHLSDAVDWLIATPAVPAAEPELQRAAALSIPVVTRGAVLPALLAGRTSVAVAGTHGKTTTAVFTAGLLAAAGRDPAWCIGGESTLLGGVAGVGADEVLVVEADESDGTLALYEADVAVVTNIEYDHMEHFEDVAAFEACFRRFIRQARKQVVFCRDDPRARALCADSPVGLSYGFSAGSDVTVGDLREDAASSCFEVRQQGVSLGRMTLPLPGRHNVLNALAAIAAVRVLGLGAEDIRRGVARLGLPRRRFEIVAERSTLLAVSDYAHHPSEIAALAETAARCGRSRIVAVFQPHRYTRTLALGPEFPPAFRSIDEVILLPVYPASEPPRAGGTTWDLYRCFREQGRAVLVGRSLSEAWDALSEFLRADDLLLLVGAGDVIRMAEWAAAALGDPPPWLAEEVLAELTADLTATDVSRREPLAPKTTLRVGGCADLWAVVDSQHDLTVALGWAATHQVPVTLLGNGSNLIVNDLGLRGLTLRLGAAFRRVEPDGDVFVAGAALSSRRLLDGLQRHGMTGLEFLEGIPGSVGGMLRMNAGAWGEAILDRVAWIRCLNREGQACIVQHNELEYGYRECRTLHGRVALEAGFRVQRATPVLVEQRRAACAARRAWMRGLRCAGSIFKNPAGDSAGRLLDAAGAKTLRVGGAFVADQHANVIVTRRGATASDVLALMEWMRATVYHRFGVTLRPEVCMPGS